MEKIELKYFAICVFFLGKKNVLYYIGKKNLKLPCFHFTIYVYLLGRNIV